MIPTTLGWWLHARFARRRTEASASTLKSRYAAGSHRGVAGLRRVLDDSFFLADGASSGTSLARAYAFAVPRPGSCVDRDVDRIGEPHWPLAGCGDLFRELGLGSGWVLVRAGDLDLFTGRSAF